MYKKLQGELAAVANTMYDLGEGFSELYETTGKLYPKFEGGITFGIENVYVSLNNTMISWGENIKKQIEIIDEHFIKFFKYYHHDVRSMRESVQSWKIAGENYIKHKQKLDLKKDKLIATEIEKDISHKEEILFKREEKTNKAFYKENEKESELRDYFAFINNSTYEQLIKAMDVKTRYYSKHFGKFARTESQMIQDVFGLLFRCMFYGRM